MKMGKKRRLNRFISKWIKSDLPEDRCSSVLLLGVTRIPTSPAPTRRPCSLPLTSTPTSTTTTTTTTTTVAPKSIDRPISLIPSLLPSSSLPPSPLPSVVITQKCTANTTTTTTTAANSDNNNKGVVLMDRSVDSIGACSLDMEASVDLTDWSEVSSGGTLRSTNLISPSAEPHLPSYLSLACTVNGYSTTTNYDPIRLSKSRDASPHRNDNLTTTKKIVPSYTVHNNLLSPPNLVPLPSQINKKMAETQQHHQYYRTSKSVGGFMTKETFTSSMFTKDTVDDAAAAACYENGHKNVTYETSSEHYTSINGQNKCTSDIKQEFSNGETKSFIQQRVERLYGPGALAQGFFVTKKQINRSVELIESSDFITQNNVVETNSMKQSTSSPTLPVLRHLRPEFRAQLPIINQRNKCVDNGLMQKSSTSPTLSNKSSKINGHSKQDVVVHVLSRESSGPVPSSICEESGTKDGHYFLKILERETERLLKLAMYTDEELTTQTLPEEAVGKIRSATGKARLLVSQKMQQFKGLCTNNITQVEGEAFPTTNEDLQGFWDMVMLQVDQVDALFKELEALKSNNWIEMKKEEQNANVNGNNNNNNNNNKIRKIKRPTSAANEEARKQREAQRKQMIEERRKAMKQNKAIGSVEIFVPESS